MDVILESNKAVADSIALRTIHGKKLNKKEQPSTDMKAILLDTAELTKQSARMSAVKNIQNMPIVLEDAGKKKARLYSRLNRKLGNSLE